MSMVTESSKTNAKISGNSSASNEKVLSEALEKYWGYESFRPLQLEAMQAVMSDRDSLIVFPTGGGKSICFQAPAVCKPGLGVVVSPLISLMKDQVDALESCGIKASFLNSSLSSEQENQVLNSIRLGEIDLLYIAPERLLTDRTHGLLSSANVAFFAIDEAHCVSQWGHDFRPEYRKLKNLKQLYPSTSVHAYTATATEQVRDDIALQLDLKDPALLVGSMDRPNLNYQIRRRQPGIGQIAEVLRNHETEPGIIYCISRKDVEKTSSALNAMGFSTLPYHAGLAPEERMQNQEDFLLEKVQTIVATVAFGMGIDKSNVRYVIHASMPKSLEAYQQESGRAGRDGLDAECWLFFNGGDYVSWKRLVDQSEQSTGHETAINSLKLISDYCNGIQCRHVALAAHFGEQLEIESCNACDVCLNELELVENPLVLGQKIASCVYRVDQKFGADYVSQVLVGSKDKRILQNKHDQVSTYGLLSECRKSDVRTWIEQLVGQGYLQKTGDYNVVTITDKGRELLRGESVPQLTKATAQSADTPSAKSTASWEGVDQSLFEILREARAKEAQSRQVPAYVVFSDASLRDMARRLPSTLDAFRMIHGVGQQKLTDYGEQFLGIIRLHCETENLETDVAHKPVQQTQTDKPWTPSGSALTSFEHFEQGKTVEEAAKLIGRAASTTRGYLTDYIRYKKIADASDWVDSHTIDLIKQAIAKVGNGPLKPIFVELGEQCTYDQIRVVAECMKNEATE